MNTNNQERSRDRETLLKEIDLRPLGPVVFKWLKTAWEKRVLFLAIWVAVTVISAVVSLLLPEQYKASATILPSGSSTSSGLLTQLGSFAGINMPRGETTSNLYPAIIKSRTLLGEVLASPYKNTTYKDYLLGDKEATPEALDGVYSFLNNTIDVKKDRDTGIIIVSFTYGEAEFTASVANEIIDKLDLYLKFRVNSEVSNQRKMIERRISEVQTVLSSVEEDLIEFREKNRVVELSPSLMISEGRLRRELEINNTIYVELTKQFELVKIEEIGDQQVMNVLDRASVPIYRSYPKRKIIVFFGWLLGFAIAAVAVRIGEFTSPVGKLWNEQFGNKVESQVK